MTIKISGNLRVDVEIPLLNCEYLEINWKPGEHASLRMEGYLKPEAAWNMARIYGSDIKVWLEEDSREQVLFHGILSDVNEKTVTGTKKVYIKGVSASILQDQKKYSRSFQDTEKSFYDIIKEVAESGDGQVICTADKEKRPEKPMIQHQETNWEYSGRLASHLGVMLVPDIETGEPNFWIGMRKGEKIPTFSEAWYVMESDTEEIRYLVKSTESYRLGDCTTFLEQELIIYEKQIWYQRGELQYYYLLGNKLHHNVPVRYQKEFTGLSLEGTVRGVKEEYLSLQLDIDQGADTGEYFYDWLPETGNALYAMPESGAPVSLYFISENEQEAIAIHCLHRTPTNAYKETYYKTRTMDVLGDQSIEISDASVNLSKGDEHNLSMSDELIFSETLKVLKINADGEVKLKAKTLTIRTKDEIKIWQE